MAVLESYAGAEQQCWWQRGPGGGFAPERDFIEGRCHTGHPEASNCRSAKRFEALQALTSLAGVAGSQLLQKELLHVGLHSQDVQQLLLQLPDSQALIGRNKAKCGPLTAREHARAFGCAQQSCCSRCQLLKGRLVCCRHGVGQFPDRSEQSFTREISNVAAVCKRLEPCARGDQSCLVAVECHGRANAVEHCSATTRFDTRKAPRSSRTPGWNKHVHAASDMQHFHCQAPPFPW